MIVMAPISEMAMTVIVTMMSGLVLTRQVPSNSERTTPLSMKVFRLSRVPVHCG